MTRRANTRVTPTRAPKLRIEQLEDRTVPTAGAVEAVKQPIGEGHLNFLPVTHTITPKATAGAGSAFLSAPKAGSPFEIATQYLQANAAKLGLQPADLANYMVTSQYADALTGTTHIYLQQTHNGLPVANAVLSINVAKSGEVINVGSTFVPGLGTNSLTAPSAALTASAALAAAVGDLGLTLTQSATVLSAQAHPNDPAVLAAAEVSRDPIPASLNYVVTADGVQLGWRYVLRTPDGQHWYDVIAAGDTGKAVWQNDWVDHATYNVLPQPNESVQDGGFSVLTNPNDTAASPFGWHDTNGIVGAEFLDTRGNNVDAHLDRDGNDAADPGSRPSGGAALNFSGNAFDATKQPYDTPAVDPSNLNRNDEAAVVNLFYANNILHDIHYHYGFTEAAGNFQSNNYGNGGAGADAVQADAQDDANNFTRDNANFATPPDGQAPRMQMYEFDLTSPRRDSDLDNGVIFHEYGHGVSNRLTGGPADANALNSLQSGGMGEGWSDFWALMLTQRPADLQNAAVPIGNYVLGLAASGGGIRRHPYSFNMGAGGNPQTFGDFNTSNEVHDAGELWATVLWDINWLLSDKYGYDANLYTGYNPAAAPGTPAAAGNKLALQLVMDGLKNQPANPTFLQARDAIILSDQVLTGGKNYSELWLAFARRGFGFSADAGVDANATIVTEAFDMPQDANIVQNFDAVTAPALPVKWTSQNGPGTSVWTTATAGAFNAPNAAFVPNAAVTSDTKLVSPVVTYLPVNNLLSFQNSYDLGAGDVATLDISINNGAFNDILVAGGNFADAAINASYAANGGFAGASGGYVKTYVNLPVSAFGKTVQFRWQLQTDSALGGPGWHVDDVNLEVLPVPDFGDAPDTFGTLAASDGARHLPGGPKLGALRDGETDAAAPLDGTGDDQKATHDEDGVVQGILNPGFDGKFKITAPTGGVLNAWVDFNESGVFEPGEAIAANLVLAPGTTTLTVPIPAASLFGTHYGRFRLTSAPVAAPSPTGELPDGEVEDYPLSFSTGYLVENFDAVAAPTLPAGWTTAFTGPGGADWATTATSSFSAPNNAFVPDGGNIADNRLTSPVFSYSPGGTLSFRNLYNTEASGSPLTYYDGGVLEISINGAPFKDILAAGGSFAAGGYVATLSSSFANPLAGRRAWAGSSGTSIKTTVNLPAAGAGQTVQLRWREGTDNGVSAIGWHIDDINVVSPNQAPVITNNAGATTVNFTIPEGVTAVTTVTAADADVPEQVLTYALSGPDAALFDLAPNGDLTFLTAPDFDVPTDVGRDNVYNVTVTVTDNGAPVRSDAQDFVITVFKPNLPPTLDGPIADLSFLEDGSAQPVTLTGIATGGELETLTVTAVSDNPAVVPNTPAGLAVSYTSPAVGGSISVKPAAEAFGTAHITVTVSDGVTRATPVTQTFTVTVTAVNDVPSFTGGPDVYSPAAAPAQSYPGWAMAIGVGPLNESAQTPSFTVTAEDPSLFDVQPAISPAGDLTFTPKSGAPTVTGLTRVHVRVKDSGAGLFPDVNTSAEQIFEINVGKNRAPILDNSGNPELIPVASPSAAAPSIPTATVVGDFATAGVTDPDPGTTFGGIAVTGADATNGVWKFSVDAGKTWADLSPVTPATALLLRQIDQVQFIPAVGYVGAATLTYRAWDQSAPLLPFGTTADASVGGSLRPFSAAEETARVRVAPIFTDLPEDAPAPGKALTAANLPGVAVTDPDGVKAKTGVAVVGSGGGLAGRWEFNVGKGWKAFGGIDAAHTTLLRNTDKVRFIPAADVAGEAFLTIRAWDQSAGKAGTVADLSNPAAVGGSTPYSSATDYLFARVTPANDRPVLDAGGPAVLSPVDSAVFSDPTDLVNPPGDLVADILGSAVTDVDVGLRPGLAVTALGGNVSGVWQYQLDGTTVWPAVPAVTPKTALVLGPDDRLRFVPAAGVFGAATLSFKAWDRTSADVPTVLADTTKPAATAAFSLLTAVATLNVTAEVPTPNQAPTLTTGPVLSLTAAKPQLEDALKTKVTGNLVNDLLANGFDDDAITPGVAVVGVTGAAAGTWQFSTDGGKKWQAAGAVSEAKALLLRDADKIRFLPNADVNGTVELMYRAWDQSRGSAGHYADLTPTGATGGTAAVGLELATATVTVTAVNDAPVLDAKPVVALPPVLPGTAAPAWTAVSALLGTALTDVDAGALRGIAITKAGIAHGQWQYQLAAEAGAVSHQFIASPSAPVFLKSGDKVRFVPSASPLFVGTESISYRGWDQTAGPTAVSKQIETATVIVDDLNHRPVLDTAPDVQLPSVAVVTPLPDPVAPATLAGQLVSALITRPNGSSTVTDADAADPKGIAVVGADNKNGNWEFSKDAGANWFRYGTPAPTTAIVLRAGDRVRFVPKAGFAGTTTLKFKAWDGRDNATPGSVVSTLTSSAFSLLTETAALAVNSAPTLSFP